LSALTLYSVYADYTKIPAYARTFHPSQGHWLVWWMQCHVSGRYFDSLVCRYLLRSCYSFFLICSGMLLCGESYTGALQIFDLTGQVQLTASTATRARKVKMTMGKKINYVDCMHH